MRMEIERRASRFGGLGAVTVLVWACFAPVHAQAQSAVSGRQAIDQLVGNTAVVALASPSKDTQDGKLHLRRDGTAVWVNIEQDAQPVVVAWSLNDREELCLDGLPKGFRMDECAVIEVSGDQMVLRVGDTSSEGHLVIRLVQGNPHGL